MLVSTSVIIGLTSLIQKEHTHMYLLRMGRQEKFIIDLENVFQPFIRGIETTLPFFNPFRLSLHIAVFSFFFIVPVLYCRIVMFRKRQDTSIKGISYAICINTPLLSNKPGRLSICLSSTFSPFSGIPEEDQKKEEAEKSV